MTCSEHFKYDLVQKSCMFWRLLGVMCVLLLASCTSEPALVSDEVKEYILDENMELKAVVLENGSKLDHNKIQLRLPQSDGLAPHLREALTLGAQTGRRWQPIDGVAAGLLFAVIGASGPTWSRVPDPFVAQTAPLVIVLKVTPSMDAPDVAPTRLERGKQKIRDLLDLRAGARTALVAYAGTAHRVVPLTEDADIMRPYLEGSEYACVYTIESAG